MRRQTKRRRNVTHFWLPVALLTQIRHVQIDCERDETDKTEAAPDASPPEFDVVCTAALSPPDSILSGEMIRRLARGVGKRRTAKHAAASPHSLKRGMRIARSLRVGIALGRPVSHAAV
jgi:hypothetical protein